MSMLSWPKAVKAWNGAAAWKDDLYALPKKGGEFYDEVRELMGHKKPATPAPVAAVLPATPAPAPVVAPVVAPAPNIAAIQSIKEAALELAQDEKEKKIRQKENKTIREQNTDKSTGMVVKGVRKALTVSEMAEYKKLWEERRPKRSDIIDYWGIEEEKMRQKIKNRQAEESRTGIIPKDQKLNRNIGYTDIKGLLTDEEAGIVLQNGIKRDKQLKELEKPLEDLVAKIRLRIKEDKKKGIIREKVSTKTKAPEPPAKTPEPPAKTPEPPAKESEEIYGLTPAELELREVKSKEHLENRSGKAYLLEGKGAILSHLPTNQIKQGFNWLKSKWGSLYEETKSKIKRLQDSGDFSKANRKKITRIDFDSEEQRKEYFMDLYFADPYIWEALNFNIVKHPATRRPEGEFKRWNK